MQFYCVNIVNYIQRPSSFYSLSVIFDMENQDAYEARRCGSDEIPMLRPEGLHSGWLMIGTPREPKCQRGSLCFIWRTNNDACLDKYCTLLVP